jgi:hypothetical protein
MAAGDFTMTALLPSLFAAARTVSKERCGTLDAIDLNFDNQGMAAGDTVKVPYTGANTVGTFTPAAYAPLGTAATASTIDVTISASYKDSWSVSDEQEQSLMNGGNAQKWLQLKTANAMRVVRNAADTAANVALSYGAAQAVGTAGTTPFQSDMSALVAARRALVDIGAPTTDLQCVMNGSAYDNLLNSGIVQQAQLAGSDAERRSGTIRPQFGFNLREDAFITAHTCGTGTSYEVAGTEAIGETSILLDTEGSGTILAGDFVTLELVAADPIKYGVAYGGGITAHSQSLVLNRPGLKVAKAANDPILVIGVSSTFTPTYCFDRSSVVGVIRPPKISSNGVIQTQIITDEFGLPYLFVRASGYGIVTYEIHQAVGFKVVNEHLVTILG